MLSETSSLKEKKRSEGGGWTFFLFTQTTIPFVTDATNLAILVQKQIPKGQLQGVHANVVNAGRTRGKTSKFGNRHVEFLKNRESVGVVGLFGDLNFGILCFYMHI